MHEFAHAELMRQMEKEGLNPNEFTEYYAYWDEWTSWVYDKALQQGTEEVHHVMIEYDKVIDKIAAALFDIFGSQNPSLTIDHFKFTVANGIFYAMELHSSTDPNSYTLAGDFVNDY